MVELPKLINPFPPFSFWVNGDFSYLYQNDLGFFKKRKEKKDESKTSDMKISLIGNKYTSWMEAIFTLWEKMLIQII